VEGRRVNTKLLGALRAIVLQLVAPTAYHVPVRYRVVQVGTDDRLRLQVVRAATGFPDTLPVQIHPGVPGAKGVPALGSTVLVQFIEGDPALPIVTHFERPDGAGFVPTSSSLDASGTVRVGESADLVHLATGSEINPLVTAAPVGRALRYGDTIGIPGIGDVVLVAGNVPQPVSKVRCL
jgi:hypothetical protein